MVLTRSECIATVNSLLSSLSCAWVNPRVSEYLCGDKPFQLMQAKLVGLSVPSTLVTNDPENVKEFVARFPRTLFKVVGGVSYLSEPPFSTQLQAAYLEKFSVTPAPPREEPVTRRVPYSGLMSAEKLTKVASVSGCPVTFQQYVEKSVEIRITVVGDELFSAEIHSQEIEETKIDFRRMSFSHENRRVPTHRVHALPDDISLKLLQLMKRLNLLFGCIDMILTPDGEYVFLEVNPSGQWNWIEVMTGLPISEALADLLVNPQQCGSL